MSSKQYDVAIIGGGITGLFTAWRIATERPEMARRIAILEATGRTGGRLKTSEVEHKKNRILVEEGGMRFLESHRMLFKVLDELELRKKVQSFGMGDDQNLYFLRGKRFTRGEGKRNQNSIWSEVYRLEPKEQGKSPFSIVEGVMNSILKGAQFDAKILRTEPWKPESPHSWALFRQMEYPKGSGLKIYQWGFRALLHHEGLSNECIQMLMDTGGFTIPYEEMVGAGTGLQLIASFPDNPAFFTLEDGYEDLPRRMAEQLVKAGVEIRLGAKVEGIRRGKEKFGIKLADGEAVSAKEVVAAIPAVPLKALLLNVVDPELDLRVRGDVAQVVHMPLTKINLFFNDEWWQTLKITHGGCFTDLPLAQVYFFKVHGLEANRKFTVVTIYSDGRRATYWRQLQQLGSDFAPKSEAFRVLSKSDSTLCKTLVVEHAMTQLQAMFGVEMKLPVFATISMWGANELLGEGDHQWAVGADDIAIRSRLNKAGPGFYICGEAVSDYQDWVEGALRSADTVLQTEFKLRPYLASS